MRLVRRVSDSLVYGPEQFFVNLIVAVGEFHPVTVCTGQAVQSAFPDNNADGVFDAPGHGHVLNRLIYSKMNPRAERVSCCAGKYGPLGKTRPRINGHVRQVWPELNHDSRLVRGLQKNGFGR